MGKGLSSTHRQKKSATFTSSMWRVRISASSRRPMVGRFRLGHRTETRLPLFPFWAEMGNCVSCIRMVPVQLTHTKGKSIDNSYAAWSPDGKKIAFASDRDGDWKIYV